MATDKKKHQAMVSKRQNETKALKAAGTKPKATKKIVMTRAQSEAKKLSED